MDKAIKLLGPPGSPYTRKMLALLRYRQIPYQVIWGSHRDPPAGYPAPKVKLLPTLYRHNDAGEMEAMVDSTPIARWLEREYAGRSAIPTNPELTFYNELIEDYADEWLTKAMFHYRWYHEADRKNAGPLLSHWSNITRPGEEARELSAQLTEHQFNRLYVVGSNDVTARTIEDSFIRLVDLLDNLLAKRGFVLGARPATCDFALFGQLSQLGTVEPTPSAILRQRSPRLRAWIDQMEDLSGLEPKDGDWFEPEQARGHLSALLREIGQVYVPFLIANAAAAQSGSDSVETEIDGRAWTQQVFPYQVKCLASLRQAYAQLPKDVAQTVNDALASCGCGQLVA